MRPKRSVIQNSAGAEQAVRSMTSVRPSAALIPNRTG
jgi:hypothetical protein